MLTPEGYAKDNSEHSHQVALFMWARLEVKKYPELELLHAIPNGGARDKITAGKLKAEGVKAGVSDLFLPVSRGSWHGLYIELKKPGGKPSKEQKEWGAKVQEQGYGFCVCDHWEKARDVLLQYLNWK